MKTWFLLFISLSVFACGGSQADTASVSNSNVSPTPESASFAAVKTVTIDSPDGVKIVGSMYDPAKPNSPALLLLHQWQSDRHSYDSFAKQMQARGFGVLSIDGRGFGDSTKNAAGAVISAGRSDKDVKGMLGDVDAAFNYLSQQTNVDKQRIGIVGASYGSSLAVIYAADNSKITAIALLSPGVNYFGNLPTLPAVKKYDRRKIIFFAAKDDPDSAESVRKLNPIGKHKPYHPEHIFDAGGHGTDLLKVGAGEEMSEFFASAFGVVPSP